MSEEEKAAQEAKEAEANAQAEADATDEQSDDSSEESEQSEDSTQFEAKLQKEREAREKAEKAAADAAFKLREKNRKKNDEDEEHEEAEKPLTRSEVLALLDAKNKTDRVNEINNIVSQMSDDDKERELIILTHKNRTYPPNLSLKEQLNEAYVVANIPKIQGENQELKRALAGKNSSSKDGSNIHHDAPRSSEPKIASADKAELARQGWKWSGTNKRHEKKMKSGTLIRHKDGKVELIKG